MEKDFWIERWEQKQTGFHQNDINPYLQKFWPTLQCDNNAKVFVPLCGKSTDLIWLNDQGHNILGIELSELAVKDFFSENDLSVSSKKKAKFISSSSKGIEILCGDFFKLQKNDLQDCHLIYDRASIVALPEKIRQNYADHLNQVLPSKAQILMITMEYPQNEMQGPPFSVPESEVRCLFEQNFEINKLDSKDIFKENQRFQARGLSGLVEKVFLLTNK